MASNAWLGGQIVIMRKKSAVIAIKANLFGYLFRDGDTWVSYCPPLKIATCGDSENKAMKMTREAIELFLDTCVNHGTLHDALIELNWELDSDVDKAITNLKGRDPEIPVFLIDNFNRNQHEWAASACANF